MSEGKKLKENKKIEVVFDPTKKPNEDEKKLLIEIVLKIAKKSEYEIPNSATFSMAIDSLDHRGIIMMVSNKKQKYVDIPETEEIKEVI
jgi:hypothetical protein